MIHEAWDAVTDVFNNREIAGAIWLCLLLALALLKKDIRNSFRGVVSVATEPKLLVLFASFAISVATLAWLGTAIGVWIKTRPFQRLFGTLLVVYHCFSVRLTLKRAASTFKGTQKLFWAERLCLNSFMLQRHLVCLPSSC